MKLTSRVCRVLLLWAVSALLWGSSLLQGADLVTAAAEGELWSKTRAELAQGILRQAQYRAVDERTYRFRGGKELPIAGIVTRDVTLLWDEEREHVVSVNTTLYNKGDDGPLEKPQFEQALKQSIEAISSAMQVEAKVRKVDKKEAGVKPRAWVWSNENCAVMLEAHSTGAGKKYVSEFIRVKIVPEMGDLERGGADDVVRRSDLKGNVKRDQEGSVWIEGIPMVDQGEKGYCVPATISRVFAYYNMDGVDQHALAAVCKSSGDEGTSAEAMNKALTSISSRFHMGVTSWRWVNPKSMEKEVGKLVQRKRIPVELVMSDPGVYGKVMLEVLKAKPAMMRKGFKDIRKYIDAGIPVVWGVMLGLFPENGLPQSVGGHMRLIIGYNEEKQMIIYSDSWGAGHELKAMPAAQACAISRLLYVLRPLR